MNVLGDTHQAITHHRAKGLRDNDLAERPELGNLSSTSTFGPVFKQRTLCDAPGRRASRFLLHREQHGLPEVKQLPPGQD